MPEIKHNFTKGKMNKDLDERLVPSGEYRDAMNIQVTTSEESGVGTVQNLLGNQALSDHTPAGSSCVGAISDEKNDAIYWLVWGSGDFDYILRYKDNTVQYVFVDKKPTSGGILNFHPEKLITGLNIIDDLLFWCDGVDDDILETKGTEPKKINITRSIQGTPQDGITHTLLINNDRDITTTTNVTDIREEHITVIKKSPQIPPDLELESTRRSGDITGEFSFSFEDSLNAGYLAPAGTSAQITITHSQTALNYQIGDILLVENKPDDPADIIYPLRDAILKLKISAVLTQSTGSGPYSTPVDCVIESIGIETNVGMADYLIDLQPDINSIFKFKFPKFALRYKYIDNEYSSFSPFSQVAFIPETWDYQTKKGLNLGMQNNLKKVTLKNIIPPNIPDDVVQVDILYKESNSTSVYLIDNVKENDGTNNWANNEFVINSELIHAILPENQMLRPWDNVPRKTLAQEITANRLVYGNYIQNYSAALSESKPDFSVSLNKHNTKQDGNIIADFDNLKKVTPLRSIKSLREYQFGVVYEDDYGRQSPIFTSDSAYINVEKKESGNTNLLDISINNEIPTWAKSFRFYVKETSNEYYTLAMDRWFDAEDGNVWLTFPSSDRNKITEESTIVLKKNVDVNTPIYSLSEYEVIAIKNEVPPYVKNTKVSYGLQKHTTAAPLFTTSPPLKDGNFITYDAIVMEDGFLSQGVLDWSGDSRISKKMYIRFHLTTPPVNVSKYYEIASMTTHTIQGGSTAGELKVSGTFGKDVEFVTDASLNVVDGISLEIARETEINKSAYDGRFFVKIVKDQDLLSSVLTYQYQSGVNVFGSCNAKFLQYQGGYHCGSHWQGQMPAGQQINRPASTFAATAVDAHGVTRSASAWGGSAWPYSSFRRTGDCTSAALTPHPHPFMPGVTNLPETTGYPVNLNTNPHSVKYHDYNMDRGGLWWRNYYKSLLGNNGKGGVWFIDMEPTFKYPWTPPAGHVNAGSNVTQNLINTPGVGACLNSIRMDVSYVGSEYRDGGPDVITGSNWDDPNNMRIHKTFTRGGKFRFNGDPGRILYTILNCRVAWGIENTHQDSAVSLGGSRGYNWNFADQGGVWRVRYELELDQVIGTTIQGEGIVTPVNHQKLGTYPGTLDETHVGKPVYHWASSTYSGTSNGNAGSGAFYDSEKRQHNPGAGWHSPGGGSAYLGGSPIIGGLSTSSSNLFPSNDPLWSWENVDGTPRLGFVPTMTKGLVHPFYGMNLDYYTPTWVHFALNTPFGAPSPNLYDIAGFNSIDLNVATQSPNNTGVDMSSSDGYKNAILLAEASGGSSFGVENVDTSANPAIWEILPKESVDLELYYEASQSYPTELGGLNSDNSKMFAPIGSVVTCDTAAPDPFPTETTITAWDEGTVTIDTAATTANLTANTDILTFTRPDGSYTTALYTGNTNSTKLYVKTDGVWKNHFGLSYFNCFAFGNGVESNRISDTFNSVTIDKGVRVSTILQDVYEEEHRKYGLIYSGIYNSTSGVNNLNQFIQAEKITKDLNPTYGSIQKLFQRRITLVTLCEDRVLKILANKDALYNADGNSQLVSTDKVLGEAQPFVGDWGISKNPESFASESYRAYFTDKQRGSVLRLSMDGLTAISKAGMSDWFKDNLKNYDLLIGSYDDRKKEYNLTLKNHDE